MRLPINCYRRNGYSVEKVVLIKIKKGVYIIQEKNGNIKELLANVFGDVYSFARAKLLRDILMELEEKQLETINQLYNAQEEEAYEKYNLKLIKNLYGRDC